MTRTPDRRVRGGSERGEGARPGKARPAAESAGGQWLWGRHAVRAALANPERKLLRTVATEEVAAELAGDPGTPTAPQILAREALGRLLPQGAVHQGIAVLARPLPPVDLAEIVARAAHRDQATIVVLDQATDPHNVGAVLRSAAAFGASAVVVPDRHAAELSGVLAKAASGAVEHIPLIRVVNLVRALEQLKSAGWWITGFSGDADEILRPGMLSGRSVLVLGAEGEGLRRLTREHCDRLVRLDTSGPIGSLNLSNAAAIALYEATCRSVPVPS